MIALVFPFLLALLSATPALAAGRDPWEHGVMMSIRDGKVQELRSLLSQVDNKKDLASKLLKEFCGDLTPLQYAAKTNAKTIQTLVSAGANPTHAHRGTQTTPLMFAARSGESPAVDKLLPLLSVNDINAKDEHGATALSLCSLSCNADIAEKLVSAGANVFSKDNTGNNALHVGAFYCDEARGEDYARTLLPRGPAEEENREKLNAMSNYGRTALMLAAKQGLRGYFSVLLDAGADPSLVSPYDNKTVKDFKEEHIAKIHKTDL